MKISLLHFIIYSRQDAPFFTGFPPALINYFSPVSSQAFLKVLQKKIKIYDPFSDLSDKIKIETILKYKE